MRRITSVIARWLAPYILAELGLAVPGADPGLSADYDQRTAEVFVSGLSDAVLPGTERFFGWLGNLTQNGNGEATTKSIASLQLARLLELDSPRQISSTLTNSLKKRAARLSLPNPWIQEETLDGWTLWRCRDSGQADRLYEATRAELKQRELR